MLAQRILTAVIGIPIIVALTLIGGPPYIVTAAVVLAVAGLEFYSATDPDKTRSPGTPAAGEPGYRLPAAPLAAAAIAGITLAASGGLDEMTGAFAAAAAAIFALLVIRGDPERGLREWMWLLAGLAYIGFLGAHLVLLRDLDTDWVLLALFATFIADTGAFFVGRPLGRRRITPAISPGKTLEGTAGGLIAGFVGVLLLAWLLDPGLSTAQALFLAVLLPPFAFIGDLAESLIKRGSGLKDASDLVPGHGGLLDRLDSLLFTVPLTYYFVIWLVY